VSSDEARRLAHDVGKYVARTARNLDERSTFSPSIAAMLTRDLYDTYGGERASAIVARSTLPGSELARAKALLAEIDALEPGVRASEPTALQRAAALAREVERVLRSLLTNGEP